MSSRASRRTSTRQAASASVERHADGAAADTAAGGRNSHKRRRANTKVEEEGEEQDEEESEEQQQDEEEGDSAMQTDGAAAASAQDEEDEQRARKKASRSHPRDQPADDSQPQLLSDRTPTHSRTASRQQQQQSPLYDGAIESARYGASPLLRVSRLAEKAELAELNKRLELYILRQRERDAAQTGLDREIALLRSKFIAESAQDKKRHEARYDELKKQKVRTHAGRRETCKRLGCGDGMREVALMFPR
jgi:hypothetical protein